MSQLFPAVQQSYATRVESKDVIVGNDALMKCEIPSFVADFVTVVGWQEAGSNKQIYAAKDMSRLGKNTIIAYNISPCLV